MTEGIPSGEYRTPPYYFDWQKPYQTMPSGAETIFNFDESGIISVDSKLFDKPYVIGDGSTFQDPRAEAFAHELIDHFFYHLSTRQLIFPEALERRAGASRFSRLGGLVDSMAILAMKDATFEQIVQTGISDLPMGAGSHLTADFMVGDYATQSAGDSAIYHFMVRSGFLDRLRSANLLQKDGRLVGSSTKLRDIADPRNPRREDIVECERPDPNVDRLQFTFSEGNIIHDQSEIREAIKHVIRLEDSKGQERLGFNNPEAARLLYELAVRHDSEHWSNPLARVVEELALMAIRSTNIADRPGAMDQFFPVDYSITDENSWYENLLSASHLDPFVVNTFKVASVIALNGRHESLDYIGNTRYSHPKNPRGVTIEEGSNRKDVRLTVAEDYSLWVALPKKKYRGPIDSLVTTKTGLKRVSEIYPNLQQFADTRRWSDQAFLVKVQLDKDTGKELRRGIAAVSNSLRSDLKKRAQSSV